MNFLFKKVRLFNRGIPVVVIVWFAFALIASVIQVLRHGYNDYLIFKGVFWHLWEQKNLFADYPQEYFDSNHYGPLFGVLIAPFSLMPTWIGAIIWALLQAALLLYAIMRLPLTHRQQLMVVAIAAVDMMTATHNLEFNSMLTAWMILAFVLVEEEKDFWAAFFIAAGFLVKLYGIGCLVFFLFSRHRVRFALSFIFWMAVLFCLPMIFSSPRFIVQSYTDWYESLLVKNDKNIDINASGGFQDISVMGFFRRTTGLAISNLQVLAPAMLLLLLPLARFRQYRALAFRLDYLILVLITVVIFSTSAESPTYVIAMTGVGIWFAMHAGQRRTDVLMLTILALVFTSLSSTNLFPQWIKVHVIRAYALKALPCLLVWLWVLADASFRDYSGAAKKHYLYEAH